ncbi:MAG TPA: alpha-1,2-fucosyltransferase, partial [Chitinophagaceae bacterium]|nr:alpha-1,2-fucosyltransferase [Chitinophagaceae bacterium]
ALAEQLNTPFRLETITSLQRDRKRHIALHDFHTQFELATKTEVIKFVFLPALYRHWPSLFSRFGRNIYREPHFYFDKNFFSLNDPVFLDGFWQSPRYFKSIETVLREEFTIKPELIKNVIEKGKEMENKSSIAVHIRRGDFLNPKIKTYHGVMSAFYFEKAIGMVKEMVSAPFVYFFSDDIEWVKQNLVVDKNSEFVSGYTQSSVEDFYLMSKCRHNVIANSSFSWWAAWLNANSGKIVVAPQKWFAVADINTNDLIPSEWIRI